MGVKLQMARRNELKAIITDVERSERALHLSFAIVPEGLLLSFVDTPH